MRTTGSRRLRRALGAAALLSASVGAQVVGTGTAFALGSLTVNDITVAEGTGGVKNAVFTVTVSQVNPAPVTVTATASDGTAVAGADYTATTATVTIPATQTTATFSVPLTTDSIPEPNETLTVTLTNPSAGTSISDATATGTLTNDDGPAPSLSVVDTALTEGNAGSTTRNVTVNLNQTARQDITASYAVVAGTAASPADVVAGTGTITVPTGATSTTVPVSVVGDALDEEDEAFTVVLSNPRNATISDATGNEVITDDDDAVVASMATPAPAAEGNAGTTNQTFSVSLSAASGKTVYVDYATSDNQAAAGSDYNATSGTLIFDAGQVSKTFVVSVLGDTLPEGNETYFADLTAAENATISTTAGAARAVATITDDETVPALSIGDATVTEGSSGTTSIAFAATLSAPSAQPITVSYATSNGSARSGAIATDRTADYTAKAGELTFAPGATMATVTVTVNSDALDEANETFAVALSAPTNATIADATAVGTITDDDATPTLSIADPTAATEGDAATVGGLATVTLSAAAGRTVTVDVTSVDGTATAGEDYSPVGQTLSFAPLETTKTVDLSAFGDTIDEVNETYTLELSGPANATLSRAVATARILDDDAGPTLSIADAPAQAEGAAATTRSHAFTVSLAGASAQAISVRYDTLNNTAEAPGDYTAVSAGSISFAPGETSKVVTITSAGDAFAEPTETFFVVLSNPVNATITASQAKATITNDDGTAPRFTVATPTAVDEGNSGVTPLSFAVTLNVNAVQETKVDFATAAGTALAGSDFTTNTGTISFAAGERTKNVIVNVLGDLTFESTEAFTLTLSNPRNATIQTASATGTITNDDVQPKLSIADVTVTEGDGGAPTATFTVTLDHATDVTVTATFATSDVSALAGGDYVARTGTVTLAPFDTSETFVVTLVPDLTHELTETFAVDITGAADAGIADGHAIGSVSDDDAAPAASISDVSVVEGDSGTTEVTLTVTLDAPSAVSSMVDYATVDGSALAPGDLESTTGTVSFGPGETSKTVVVNVVTDSVHERDETFTVQLSGPVETMIGDGSGIGTIVDDDAAPTITIDDVTVTEGTGGLAIAELTVHLAGSTEVDAVVAFSTTTGSASGPDFQATTGSLTIPPGQLSGTISIPVVTDALDEDAESFGVDLGAATDAAVIDAQGVVTITDDDDAPTVSIGDASVVEGDSDKTALVPVTLSAPSSKAITVEATPADGSATAPADYTAGSGSITFAPGATSASAGVPIVGDNAIESDEALVVTLSNPVNATVADASGVLTVVDDDDPFITIDDRAVTEGNSGSVAAPVTVRLSVPQESAVTVAFATAATNATADADFVSTSGTVTFGPGQTTRSIPLSVIGDLLDEPIEAFQVRLSAPAGARVFDSYAVVRINDDDAAPRVSASNVSVTEGDTNADVTVSLSAPSGRRTSIDVATANGSATAGPDYTAVSTVTLVFEAGQTTKTIAVPVKSDALDEVNETAFVLLSNPQLLALGVNGRVTIVDDDTSPTLSIDNVTVTEGGNGATTAAFTVSLSTASGRQVSVTAATEDGTAAAGSDYTAVNRLVTIPAGHTSAVVTVTVAGDTTVEPNETFRVRLSSPSAATIVKALGLGTITNDDS